MVFADNLLIRQIVPVEGIVVAGVVGVAAGNVHRAFRGVDDLDDPVNDDRAFRRVESDDVVEFDVVGARGRVDHAR